jgi:Family of unknown function (DUF5317)
MALALPVLLAVLVGLVLGGNLSGLGELRLRGTWLLFTAVGLQIAAFPFGFLPWSTSRTTGTVLWLASYALLTAGAVLNLRTRGVPLLAAGMGANLLAILANGGTMPVLPSAMHAAGRTELVHANSTAAPDPSFAWLVDRFAAPDWIPLANVFSVGDVAIAAGAIVVVLTAMGVELPRRAAPRRRSAEL